MDTGDEKLMDSILKDMELTKAQKVGAKKLLEEINAQNDVKKFIESKPKTPTVGEYLTGDDIERIMSFLQEHFTCFSITGYDMGGNKFSEQYAPTDMHWDVTGKMLVEEANNWITREAVYKKMAFVLNNPDLSQESEGDGDFD